MSEDPWFLRIPYRRSRLARQFHVTFLLLFLLAFWSILLNHVRVAAVFTCLVILFELGGFLLSRPPFISLQQVNRSLFILSLPAKNHHFTENFHLLRISRTGPVFTLLLQAVNGQVTPRSRRIIIWQDQVDPLQWRNLHVLARWYALPDDTFADK